MRVNEGEEEEVGQVQGEATLKRKVEPFRDVALAVLR